MLLFFLFVSITAICELIVLEFGIKTRKIVAVFVVVVSDLEFLAVFNEQTQLKVHMSIKKVVKNCGIKESK